MRIGDSDNLNFRDACPVKATVGLPRRFIVAANQDEAVRMFDIHGELLVAVATQLVEPGLRQLGELYLRRASPARVFHRTGDTEVRACAASSLGSSRSSRYITWL